MGVAAEMADEGPERGEGGAVDAQADHGGGQQGWYPLALYPIVLVLIALGGLAGVVAGTIAHLTDPGSVVPVVLARVDDLRAEGSATVLRAVFLDDERVYDFVHEDRRGFVVDREAAHERGGHLIASLRTQIGAQRDMYVDPGSGVIELPHHRPTWWQRVDGSVWLTAIPLLLLAVDVVIMRRKRDRPDRHGDPQGLRSP